MLRIRLRRVGAKKNPSYRIVVADAKSPRNGRFVENIGTYNPHATSAEAVNLQEDRAFYWLGVGAQPSDSVARLFKANGTTERFEAIKSGRPVEAAAEEAAADA